MFKARKLLLLLLASGNLLQADVPVVAPEDYSSGKAKLIQIMENEQTGVAAYNREHNRYAQIENLAQDLNVDAIADFFDCKTEIGRSFITETLKCPLTSDDKAAILARQQAIRTLVENDELRAAIGLALDQAKQEEQAVIKLLSDYFKGKTCPELAQLEVIKQQNPVLYPYINFLHTNPTAKAVVTGYMAAGLAIQAYGTSLFAKMTYHLARNGGSYGESAAYTGFFLVTTAFSGYGCYKDYANAAEKREKIHAINQLISIAEHCRELLAKNGVTTQFSVSPLASADKADDKAQRTQLLEALQHSRYAQKNTWVFNTAAVHTFLYRLYEEQNEMAFIFASIAEIDAYHAIATKIVEAQQSNNKLCFVTFVEQEKPVIKAVDFWNVLVKNAVTNSVSEDRHVILTGPNAGGKTTSIRALLQNIALGQTFGVAAAREFEFTAFDVIHSYLNISDDLINGFSLFASEVNRAKGILQTIESLKSNAKFFFALDELFTGTVAEDGEECAYSFVNKLAKYQSVQFVYATHFEKLKELGNEHASCANYRVEAPVKNADGKLVYPYILSQGASQSRVALDLARQAGLFE